MTASKRYQRLIKKQGGKITSRQLRHFFAENGLAHQTIADTLDLIPVADPKAFADWLTA